MSLFISTYLVVFERATLTRAGSFYSGQNCTACTYVTDRRTDLPFRYRRRLRFTELSEKFRVTFRANGKPEVQVENFSN